MDGIFNVLRFNWLYLKIAKVQLQLSRTGAELF